MKFINIHFIIIIIIFFCFNSIYSESISNTFIEFSPEFSYGVIDNGPAWIEMIPFKAEIEITSQTAIKGAICYAYEIDRDKKPFGPPNHYGWGIIARFEHSLSKNDDMRFFYEMNLGRKVPGAVNDINYLQMSNWQRFGIVFRIWKII